jgi:CxxC motif-containing protein (DUF1111 family)
MRRKRLAFAIGIGPIVAAMAVLSMGQVATPTSTPTPNPNPGSGGGIGDPLPNVTNDELARFLAGQAAFEDEEDVADGLGPVFNENSCVTCHEIGATGGGGTRLETRFGRYHHNGMFDPMAYLGGSLMQDQGIGLVGGVNYVAEVVPSRATVVASRRTIPLFGLGLVDNVPDMVFQQLAWQAQSCNSPTAGRVNMVLNAATGEMGVGRFGWKCQQPALLSFAGDAYLNEMGITTPMFPNENCPQGRCGLLQNPALPPVPNDSDNSSLVEFADFMTFLAPVPRRPSHRRTEQGSQLFSQIGCDDCHVRSLQTGPNHSAALDSVIFFPYSDFLLHDMGSLGDGIAQSGAGPREMRTAPLWGVRLAQTLLHDGSATNLTDAILAHDGQARAARNRFAALSDDQQAQLIAFLKSL